MIPLTRCSFFQPPEIGRTGDDFPGPPDPMVVLPYSETGRDRGHFPRSRPVSLFIHYVDQLPQLLFRVPDITLFLFASLVLLFDEQDRQEPQVSRDPDLLLRLPEAVLCGNCFSGALSGPCFSGSLAVPRFAASLPEIFTSGDPQVLPERLVRTPGFRCTEYPDRSGPFHRSRT